jgi:group I intron endonuclease
MIGIYKITNPKGKIYIGQTIDFQRRVYQYKMLNCKEQPKLYNSLKKYGFQNHKIELIYQCDIDSLTFFERYYQEKYKTIEDNNLNCFLVTTKDKTGKHTDETKIKISNALKGKKKTAEHISRLPQNQKGKFRPKSSAETKLKMILNNGMSKKVYQYSKESVFLKEHISTLQAEHETGATNISSAALGRLKQSGGFKWSYTKF